MAAERSRCRRKEDDQVGRNNYPRCFIRLEEEAVEASSVPILYFVLRLLPVEDGGVLIFEWVGGRGKLYLCV